MHNKCYGASYTPQSREKKTNPNKNGKRKETEKTKEKGKQGGKGKK